MPGHASSFGVSVHNNTLRYITNSYNSIYVFDSTGKEVQKLSFLDNKDAWTVI